MCYHRNEEADDPVLTPGHLLIGEHLLVTAEPEKSSFNFSERYEFRKKLIRNFFFAWSKDYSNQLQVRQRWFKKSSNLNTDDIVLVKDNSLMQSGIWSMAKVLRTFPGADGKVRKVEVMVKSRVFIRPITSIICLSISSELSR